MNLDLLQRALDQLDAHMTRQNVRAWWWRVWDFVEDDPYFAAGVTIVGGVIVWVVWSIA